MTQQCPRFSAQAILVQLCPWNRRRAIGVYRGASPVVTNTAGHGASRCAGVRDANVTHLSVKGVTQ